VGFSRANTGPRQGDECHGEGGDDRDGDRTSHPGSARNQRAEPTGPDRPLDVAIGEVGEGDRDDQLDETAQYGGQVQPTVIEEDDHRPVPHVEGVADQPDSAQWLRGEEPLDDRSGPGCAGDDRGNRQDAQHGESAAEGDGGRVVQDDEPDHQDEQRRPREPPCDSIDSGGEEIALTRSVTEGATAHQYGDDCADEQLEGAGVGAVVDPTRVGTGHVESAHSPYGKGGEYGERPGHDPVAPPGAGREREQDDQQQREDQVELLLDRQRPGVHDRRRHRQRTEVLIVRQQETPVRDVEECAENVPGVGTTSRRGRPDRRDHRDREQHEDERRQEPSGTRQPEAG
jgi:hypothetical protein